MSTGWLRSRSGGPPNVFKCLVAKLGEEKLTFQKAPGKLEPTGGKAQAGPRSSW